MNIVVLFSMKILHSEESAGKCLPNSLYVVCFKWRCLFLPTVADAWRALKNPSIGESSIEGLTSVLSTSGSPTDGLSVMQGPYSETASFAALSGGTLSGGILSSGKGKYSR